MKIFFTILSTKFIAAITHNSTTVTEDVGVIMLPSN